VRPSSSQKLQQHREELASATLLITAAKYIGGPIRKPAAGPTRRSPRGDPHDEAAALIGHEHFA
jgi:hypothetical protein